MTKIEWVKDLETGEQGRTWNPTVGCSRKSEGCRHCYAERMATRLQAMGRSEYQGTVNGSGRWTGVVNLVPERLEEPLRRRKPTTYFVDSMSDLFHPSIPAKWLIDIFAVMRQTPQHTYQVLTKRPERARDVLSDELYPIAVNSQARCDYEWPLSNVWLGVSVEDQCNADLRREAFETAPAAVKFVSYEPALGLVDWRGWEFIDQLICGGESGPGARPMHPDWARAARDWAKDNDVAFFFKQFGRWKEIQFDKRGNGDVLVSPFRGVVDSLNDPFDGGPSGAEEFKRTVAMRPLGKKAAGRLMDGCEHSEMPKGA